MADNKTLDEEYRLICGASSFAERKGPIHPCCQDVPNVDMTNHITACFILKFSHMYVTAIDQMYVACLIDHGLRDTVSAANKAICYDSQNTSFFLAQARLSHHQPVMGKFLLRV